MLPEEIISKILDEGWNELETSMGYKVELVHDFGKKKAIEFADWINNEQKHNHLHGDEDYGWWYETPAHDQISWNHSLIGDTSDLYDLFLAKQHKQ